MMMRVVRERSPSPGLERENTGNSSDAKPLRSGRWRGSNRLTVGDAVTILDTPYTQRYLPEAVGKHYVICNDDMGKYRVAELAVPFSEKDAQLCSDPSVTNSEE